MRGLPQTAIDAKIRLDAQRERELEAQFSTQPNRPTSSAGWLTPQLAPRQDSLGEQLRTLIALGDRAGCYDAVDFINRKLSGPFLEGER